MPQFTIRRDNRGWRVTLRDKLQSLTVGPATHDMLDKVPLGVDIDLVAYHRTGEDAIDAVRKAMQYGVFTGYPETPPVIHESRHATRRR